MKRATLVLPLSLGEELAEVAKTELETAGVLLVGIGRSRGELRLIGREVHFIPDDGYDERRSDRLLIPSRSYVRMLARAETLNATAVFLHTHPAGVSGPQPSRWDDDVDNKLAEVFRIRTGSEVYASLILSPTDVLFSFTGRGRDMDDRFEIERALVCGDRIALISAYGAETTSVSPIFDRQVRAFGGGIQRALANLRAGVVGCGGTGSSVAEQLVRLGLRSLVLVDDDDVDGTNVTRLYGSTPDDVGEPKVEVLAHHLNRIAPACDIRPVKSLVLDEQAARSLAACDVLFGCTDDNAGRLVLTRLAAYYLVPLIDCGVLISSANGKVEAIHGRVTVQTPGAACLVCRNRIDLARASAEQLPADERAQRQREGYAPELDGAEPAVVTFTTMVASQAVTELLERLSGFGPEPVPTEVLFRFHDREISTNKLDARPGHFCHAGSGHLGLGDTEPFLGQLWKAS